MVSEPNMIVSSRLGKRAYHVGPGGAPVNGFRPALLLADTPIIGRASRVGRKFHKVIHDNLGRLWLWPQCHRDTCKKRFGFLKSRFRREFIYLYEVDHTLLGMLTHSSWNVCFQAICHGLNPLERRRRPDLNSPDPNTVLGARHQLARREKCLKRRQEQRKRRKLRRREVVPPPPPPPPPVAPVAPRPPPPPPLRVAVEQRSAFSREMERNEILRRRGMEYSTSSSGLPTTRVPSEPDPERQEIPEVPDIRNDPAYAECIHAGECLGHPKKSVTLKCPVNFLLREEVPRLNLVPNFPWRFPPGSGGR